MKAAMLCIVLAAALGATARAGEETFVSDKPSGHVVVHVEGEAKAPPAARQPPPEIGSETVSEQGRRLDPRGEGFGGRAVLLRDKIAKLREERSFAVRDGKPVEAIDAEIAQLRRELARAMGRAD